MFNQSSARQNIKALTLAAFPIEILCHIFSYLDFNVLTKISEVDKHFNNPMLWKKLILRYFTYLLSQESIINNKKSFKVLFLEEYKRYQTSIVKREWQIEFNWVLVGLNGDLARLKDAR